MKIMKDSPADHSSPSKPFLLSGVDYTNPLNVRLAETRDNITQKGYIVIFMCFSSQIIHL